jgi:DNA polymerase-3 subunit epsilon
MNARYDFTLLDRETRRHFPGMRPFHPELVLDPYVLDKHASPYRKGKRNLVALCAALGIPVEANAHDAGADCLMAARAATYLLTHRRSPACRWPSCTPRR